MRIGVGFNADMPVPQMMTYASLVEKSGYDSFWMHEHSFARDALSYLNAAASTTNRLKIGVACLSPYTRHPVVLAMSFMTLQEASRGRAILGLGTGFPMRLDLMGIRHDTPIATIRECIEICRGIWSGNVLNYSGKVFQLKNVKSLSGGAFSKIPIYIAGWKKQMLNLTGRFGDGYVAKGGESTHSMAQIVNSIEKAASNHGRKMDEIYVCAYLLTLVAHSKEEAFDMARKDPFVNYMLSVQDDYLYEGTGIDPIKKKPIAENYFKGNISEASKYITDEMLDAFALVGTCDQVCLRISEFKKAGLDLPILQPIRMDSQSIRDVINAGSMMIESE